MTLGFTGARCPRSEPLGGRHATLEPLRPEHAGALHEAGADERIWTYLPYGPWPDPEDWTAWVEQAAATVDPWFYAVCTDRPRGVVSFLRCEAQHGSIEIGHIWFGAGLARTTAATEAVHLLARHAFDDLGHRRLEWKCNAANDASRRAAERFGFTYEGTFRQHMVVKGSNRDTAWFSITDAEWPERRGAFEAFLAPENFDADGRQRQPLGPPSATTSS